MILPGNLRNHGDNVAVHKGVLAGHYREVTVRAHPATEGHVDIRRGHSPSPILNASMKASCGTSTEPTIFIRFLPSFWRSSSLRLRVMSPP